MLAKGIQLTLMIGPVVPIPAPRVVMDALDSVEVTTAAGSVSGFQISFQFSPFGAEHDFCDRRRQLHRYGMPPLRVMLIVTLNGTPQPLFDGVITNVEMQPGARLCRHRYRHRRGFVQGNGCTTGAACRFRPCRSRRAWR